MALKRINSLSIIEELDSIEQAYPGNTMPPAIKYVEQAKVGNEIADYIISKSKSKKEMKDAKKQLQEASKQLKKLRKDIIKTIDHLGFETAPKHLWSVIQLIQQSQHVYVASTESKKDEEIFFMVADFIRNVPSVWAIANTIDNIAEQKRKLSGQIVNNKG